MTQQQCTCKEMSCKKECASHHTHKVFSCKKCETQQQPKKWEENDDPEISEKDFEDMYISQGKNETEKMERRFNIWLENRDDDFELDIWQFRCLQDFIAKEKEESRVEGMKEALMDIKDSLRDSVHVLYAVSDIEDLMGDYAKCFGIDLADSEN